MIEKIMNQTSMKLGHSNSSPRKKEMRENGSNRGKDGERNGGRGRRVRQKERERSFTSVLNAIQSEKSK